MMTLLNTISENDYINQAEYKNLLIQHNPFAPHITEELYHNIYGGYIHNESWPAFDLALCTEDMTEIAIQISGKVRAKLMIKTDESEESVIARAKETVAAQLEGKQIVKELYVTGRLVNIVAK
jgi:leucyl-tRNA synthetase